MPFEIPSEYEIELADVDDSKYFEELDCGVPSINRYLFEGTAYYDHIMKFSNTKLIKIDGHIVGYFTLQFQNIKIEEEGTVYPCIYAKYLCIHRTFQRTGIGSKVLDYIVSNAKEISDFVGCRCLFINAITTEIQWYRDRGFEFVEDNDIIDMDKPTIEMIIDYRDNELIERYFDI